jgi:hypothetical protein
METKLRLLTRDGALGLLFRPKLTPQQYDELFKASVLADNRGELREAAKKLAIEWHSDLNFDE